MYDAGAEYNTIAQSDNRKVSLYLTLGSSIDPTAADDYDSLEGDLLPMSNINQIVDANYTMTELLATFEADGIPSAPEYGVVVPPVTETAYPPEVGIWSASISDANGNIDYTFKVNLSASHTSGFTVYTNGPTITAGTVTFINGSESTEMEMLCGDGFALVSEPMTYDAIEVHVSTISEPYKHLRIVEVEFGASVTLTRDSLGGELTCIEELDPLELSMPLSELDFSIINVLGEYDVDNPVSKFGDVTPGAPVVISYTIEGGVKSHTVPCGTYYVASKDTSGNFLAVTAYDPRWLLSEIYVPWTITTDMSIGEQVEAVMNEYNVPHLVDPALFEVYFEAGHTFDDDDSLLDDLLQIQQAYGIYFIPRRDGAVHVTTELYGGDYGLMDVNGIFSWPSPVTFSSYNFIRIQYGGDGSSTHHEIDLRTEISEPKAVLKVGNPLILTLERAQALANRILGRMFSVMTETEWIGDPTVDLYDTIEIPGKWTQSAPTSYHVRQIEQTYNGALRMSVRGVK